MISWAGSGGTFSAYWCFVSITVVNCHWGRETKVAPLFCRSLTGLCTSSEMTGAPVVFGRSPRLLCTPFQPPTSSPLPDGRPLKASLQVTLPHNTNWDWSAIPRPSRVPPHPPTNSQHGPAYHHGPHWKGKHSWRHEPKVTQQPGCSFSSCMLRAPFLHVFLPLWWMGKFPTHNYSLAHPTCSLVGGGRLCHCRLCLPFRFWCISNSTSSLVVWFH